MIYVKEQRELVRDGFRAVKQLTAAVMDRGFGRCVCMADVSPPFSALRVLDTFWLPTRRIRLRTALETT